MNKSTLALSWSLSLPYNQVLLWILPTLMAIFTISKLHISRKRINNQTLATWWRSLLKIHWMTCVSDTSHPFKTQIHMVLYQPWANLNQNIIWEGRTYPSITAINRRLVKIATAYRYRDNRRNIAYKWIIIILLSWFENK